MSEDFGDFTVEPTRKPVAGVSEVQIPEQLANLLAKHAPKALTDPDFELTLKAKDEATAKKLALYARAWGARQEPKLYIKKIPNRRDMPNSVARLDVSKDEDVKPENRAGRRASK